MSSEETPQLSAILISTFIEQCSQPFDCGMQPILDSFGKTNTIFCEDGFAYLSPEPPDEITYPKFDKVIDITASSDEYHPNQESEQKDEQNNNPQEDDQHSDQKDASEQPNKNENNEEKLQSLTNELKSLIEKVADITIEKLSLQWGLSDKPAPYLIACNELSYKYSEELSPFIDILPQILLFISYEGVLPVEAGQCITPNKKCVGAQMFINRQKFEIVQIQKHFSSIVKKLNSTTDDDDTKKHKISLDKLGNYIIKRLVALFPQAIMSSVPCCKNCFGIYSCASFSSSSKSSKKQLTMNRTNSRLSQTRGNLTSSKRSEKNQMKDSMKDETTSNQALKTQMPPTKPKSQFEPFQKTKSGLTVIQNISQKTYMQSINIYSEEPFIHQIKKT